MKKTVILSAAILAFSSFSANAGGFHLSIFSPAPIYAPAPVYVVEPRPVYYPQTYAYYYPANNYDYEHNFWYSDDWARKHHHRNHRKHGRHGRDDDDN